jgi:hypothetical protein
MVRHHVEEAYTMDEIPYNSENSSRMKPDQRNQTERLRELEAENTRLKHAVALLTVDKLLLEEAVEENSRGSARSYPSGR